MRGWREVQEGENIYLLMSNSHYYVAETNATL